MANIAQSSLMSPIVCLPVLYDVIFTQLLSMLLEVLSVIFLLLRDVLGILSWRWLYDMYCYTIVVDDPSSIK